MGKHRKDDDEARAEEDVMEMLDDALEVTLRETDEELPHQGKHRKEGHGETPPKA